MIANRKEVVQSTAGLPCAIKFQSNVTTIATIRVTTNVTTKSVIQPRVNIITLLPSLIPRPSLYDGTATELQVRPQALLVALDPLVGALLPLTLADTSARETEKTPDLRLHGLFVLRCRLSAVRLLGYFDVAPHSGNVSKAQSAAAVFEMTTSCVSKL